MGRVRTIAFFALLLGGRAVGAEPPPAAAPDALVVRVTTAPRSEGATPPPVPGAVVIATDEDGERGRATTGADGVARLAGLAAGEYTVRVEADRFVDEEKEVSVEEGEPATVSVALSPGVPFDGTVLDDETGKPLGGATIAVEARGSVGGFTSAEFRAPYARAQSDAEGRFHVRGVPEGKVATVEASARGYASGAFSLRILGGQVTPAPVVVRLVRGGSIRGVVRTPQGKPVPDATVYVVPAASPELRSNPRGWRVSSSGEREQAVTATSGPDGSFRVEGLPLDDTYVAVAEAEGFARSSESPELTLSKAKREAEVELTVRAAPVLVVKLVDLAGKPVLEKAKVEVGASFMTKKKKETPDNGNSYRFLDVEPGEQPIHVESPSFRDAWAKAVLEAGKETVVTVRLDPGLTLSGVTVDEEGKPVAGAHVGVKTVGGEDPSPDGWTSVPIFGRTVESDAAGRFTVRGLSPKEAEVEAFGFRGPEKDSYRTTTPVRVKPPATDVRLVLVRWGSAVVRLVTPDGKPYTGPATVMNGKKRVSSGGSSRTIVDGLIVVTSLEEAEYELDVYLRDYLNVRLEYQGRLRTRLDLGTVTLDPGIAVAGRVVDLVGVPVPGARVSGGESGGASDAKGAFVLEHESRGKGRITARAEGFVEAGVDVVVEPGLAPVEIRLPRGALVKGVLQDADGAPSSEDLFVWRMTADGKRLDDEEEIVSPGRKGTFSQRLPAGVYRIVARASEGGEPPVLADVTVKEGETRELVLKLP